MTRTAISIVVAVLLLVGGWFGYEKYREHQRTKHDEAIGKVEVFTGEVGADKDTIKTKLPGVAHTDSNLSRAIVAPSRVTVVRWLHDTVGVDSSAYVPRADYDTLWTAFDGLRTAAIAYRDSSRALLIRYPRLIAEQDSVIKYQRVALDTPKPSRRWGLGVHAGYGGTLHNGLVVQGPQGGVSVSYRIF